MKKVLVFGLKNQIGGIENYLLSVQRQLAGDYQFLFLVENDGSAILHRQSVEQHGGEILELPRSHPVGAYIRALDAALKKGRAQTELLYVNIGDLTVNVLLALLLGHRHGFRIVTHSHSAKEEVSLTNGFVAVRHGVIKHMALGLLRSDRIRRAAVSRRAGDFLYGSGKYHLIPPGIPSGTYRFDAQTRRKLRSQYKLAEETLLLGYVGRLVEVKNPLYLLDVLERVRQTEPKAKLMIVGEGYLEKQLSDEAARRNLLEYVIFTGATKVVWEYLQAFDVMLAPSHSEGLGLTVIEAQAAGVPVICAQGSFPEEVALTELVDMASLEEPQRWAQLVLEKAGQNPEDRHRYYAVVAESLFEESRAAARLKEVLQAT